MLLTSAEAFIRSNSRKPWTIRGMRREEQSDYPFRAVREVLVNALIHRDYQYAGAEVHVDMYDDRMEITSPGGMMSGSRIQDLNLHHVPSMRRNEIISDIIIWTGGAAGSAASSMRMPDCRSSLPFIRTPLSFRWFYRIAVRRSAWE